MGDTPNNKHQNPENVVQENNGETNHQLNNSGGPVEPIGPRLVVTPPGPLVIPGNLGPDAGWNPFQYHTIPRPLSPADTLLAGGQSLEGIPRAFGAKRQGSPAPPVDLGTKRPKISVKVLTKQKGETKLRKGRKPEPSEEQIIARAQTQLEDLLVDSSRTNVHFTLKEILRLNELIRITGNVKHDIAQSGNSLLVLVRLAETLWKEMIQRYNILMQEARAERVARLTLEERVTALELHESQARMEVDEQVPMSEIHALRAQNAVLMQKVEELTKTLAEHVAATPAHPPDGNTNPELLALREENSGLREQVTKLITSVSAFEQAQLATEASHSEELSKLREENATLRTKLNSQETAGVEKGDSSGRKKKGKQKKTPKPNKAPVDPKPAGKEPGAEDQNPTPPDPAGKEGEGTGSDGSEDGFTVVKHKKARKPKPRTKGEAVVIKAGEERYATILRSMRTDPRLAELGKNTRTVRRTRKNELLLVLGKGASGASEYAQLVGQVVTGDDVAIRSLSQETTIQCKNLDETVNQEDLLSALEEQCGTGKLSMEVRFKKYAQGTQTATFQLPESTAAKVLKCGKLKVNWSICPITQVVQPAACYKCFGYGHKSWACKGPDRSQLCRRCGGEGHKAKGCQIAPKCLLCPDGSNSHATGSPICPSYKRALAKAKPCR